MPSKTWDRKSMAIKRMHSCGPVAAVGSIPSKPGNISLVMSMFTCVAAMRGSVCSVSVSGGGHGFPASHVRSERLVLSLARRKLKAVDPVRGSPRPKRGATICCSSISGCRANHCSTSSRFTRRPTIWSFMTLSPSSLSADSLVTESTRTSSPSRQVSSPKSSDPARATAVSMTCSTCIGMAPIPCRGPAAATIRLRDCSPRFRIQAGDASDRLQGELPTIGPAFHPKHRGGREGGEKLPQIEVRQQGGARRFALPFLRPRVQHRQMHSSTPESGRTVANAAGGRLCRRPRSRAPTTARTVAIPKARSPIDIPTPSDARRPGETDTQGSNGETGEARQRALGRFGGLSRRALLGTEAGRHILLRPPFSLQRNRRQHLLVRRGERRLDHAPGPEVPDVHHIDLGGVQGDLRRQVEEADEAEDECEGPVLLAGVS